jgi:sterol desaturase/sphingolipid hydroxylase (fatty acid hydroxylase superfamily)
MSPDFLENMGQSIDDAFFLFGAAIFGIEVLKLLFDKPNRGRSFLDMIASFTSQVPSILIEIFVLSIAYVGYVWVADTYISWQMPLNVWTIILGLIACDMAYYWEHRLAHQIRFFWTQHAVHHSSRYMNISVAFRFGPFEGLMSALVHFPLVLIGFPPDIIFFGILAVLAYQTWIHTELIGKLGPFDTVFNSPANHRVHHGSDDKYIDKNYGGILMLWDQLFGTYQKEEETPIYGLKRDFDSVNPLVVWVSEIPQYVKDVAGAKSIKDAWMFAFGRPGWRPSPQNVPDARAVKTPGQQVQD